MWPPFKDPHKLILLRVSYFGFWSIYLLSWITVALYYVIKFQRLTDIIILSTWAAIFLIAIIKQVMYYYDNYWGEPYHGGYFFTIFEDYFPSHTEPRLPTY